MAERVPGTPAGPESWKCPCGQVFHASVFDVSWSEIRTLRNQVNGLRRQIETLIDVLRRIVLDD